VVPRAAGVASALGLITADLVVDRVRTWIAPLAGCDAEELVARYDELEGEAGAELPASGGELLFTRSADVRYRGQAHQLTVPVPSGPLTVAAIEAAFAEEYRRTYAIDASGPTELVNLRVRALRKVDKLVPVPVAAEGPAPPVPRTRRPVCFAGATFTETAVYAWDDLAPGTTLAGPMVIEGADTSVVVPPGSAIEVDPWSNLALLEYASDQESHT
jgi:N-methylhydantoinase A